MQFAIKDKHSTVMFSVLVKEVVHYFVDHKWEVYSSCVDATKSFNRVTHDNLFAMFIERKIPAIALRVLLETYQKQRMRTVWSGKFSRLFDTSRGI